LKSAITAATTPIAQRKYMKAISICKWIMFVILRSEMELVFFWSGDKINHHSITNFMSHALVIIDFINEFLHPDGKITSQGMGAFCEKYKTIENAKKLIDAFRKNKEEIIWVHLGFHENYDNCSTLSPRFK
jgi:hypothetical protein